MGPPAKCSSLGHGIHSFWNELVQPHGKFYLLPRSKLLREFAPDSKEACLVDWQLPVGLAFRQKNIWKYQ
ncbi:hypothetical protein GCK72_022849 [Caenorhabditis remanei]|uniref:Uncharacterized protein n=1 Tax=Caenorhabditis remanei TaxID=31234 RepID=A0A6A5FV65_CAERE|nr:hypothetical protein GCK72_022849 [Caenorhabditis remanei]KAF1746395.1 hypothetical protein GCK72_022849 [Caenorhabditis remanei]